MIATRDGNAGVRDVPSVSGLTHVVTVVHLTERGDTGVKMFRGTQWVLSSTCFNEWLCWFQEEIPNTWLHVWIRGPNQGMICSPGCCCYCFLVSQSCLKLCDSTDYSLPGSSVHRDSPGKNLEVGRDFPTPGYFPNPGLNLCLLHWQADSLPLCHQGSPQPRITEI